ncbi:MAG: ribonuclease H [Trueperaceae bacterium]|nr:ribonuclease H [Trueperaceae bacterium]
MSTSSKEKQSSLSIDAWTDGASSGNPGPGGWGVVLVHGEHTRELNGGDAHTTNNRMELTAVLRAVEALKQPATLLVHTDSELAINLVTGRWKRRDTTLRGLCEEIEKLAEQKGVTLRFKKVKGHAGVALNERADALARAATPKR